MSNRVFESDAQIVLSVMFEALSIVHSGQGPKDREACMEWARDQLRKCEIDVHPMGSAHAVIKKPVLCAEDPEWDWWLNLPPAHRGAIVKHYKSLLEDLDNGRRKR